MTEKFIGIVIDITRHSDRLDIVTLFTRSRGRLSFLSPTGSGKSGKMRQSRLQPLAVIEGDFNFKATADLQRLGTFSMHRVWSDIYFNPIKQMITLFLSEFLNKLLRASMADENMWDYIFQSLVLLDGMDTHIADFHIVFLASLLPFAGIQPDIRSYSPGMVFDMQAGVFKTFPPLHRDYLSPDDTIMAAKLCKVDFYNVKALRLNGQLRLRILEGLLHYYGLHFPGTSRLKSLSVIHDVFS